MTEKEKLEKLKKLADAMYYAAQYLTTDASRLHKAMDEYHQFIIHEYHREEPEYLEEETTYCAFSTSRYTDKERKSLCKGCEEECRFNKKEVLIGENLLQASIAYADAHSEYCTDKNGRVVEHYNIRAKEHFIAGAKWQKEQFEKNRLKHCNSITNKQAELEQGFIDQHLDKHQRMPTFLDAIEYGMKLQNEQMMAKVIDGDITFDYYGDDDKTYGCIAHDSFCLEDFGLKDMDKVKMILIKE